MNDVFKLGFGQNEEISINNLPIEGQIPKWLTGTLLRNGPGTFNVGEQQYRHWFDGLAMLHKFSFGNGRISYANKFLESKSYQAAQENGRISYSEFATDPCRSLFQRVQSIFQPQVTDSAKVSIAQVANRFIALAETPIQVEFDPETLKTVGVFNYEDRIVGQMTTVHPHFDHARDTMYNVVTRYNAISHYRLYEMVGRKPPRLVGQIPVKNPSYMHSFGLTQNYVIITEFPLVVNPISLLLWLKPYIENFAWKPKQGTPFYVMNRFTGELVGKFDADPFFAFHHINAFEKGDELIIDINAYEDASIVQNYYLNRLSDTATELPFGQFRRYRLPLNGRRVSYEVMSDACIELPRFDYERYNTKEEYQYTYAVSINPQQRQGFYNQLVKVDIHTGQDTTWFAPGCYPGEPVFVGNPERIAEDDGVILSVVLDANRGTSFLLVLDAQSFTERARAEIPHAVLFGYHGDYFSN